MKRWQTLATRLNEFDKNTHFETLNDRCLFYPHKSDTEKLILKHTEEHYSSTGFYEGCSSWWVVFLTEFEDAIVFQDTFKEIDPNSDIQDIIALDYIHWLTEEEEE
jgi:hypothetical protein